MQSYLSKLNEDQREAVINFVGPSFVLACPGAGKTLTIAYRVAYMIDCGVSPNSIMLFTFTKKAANELKERIERIIGKSSKYVMVGTYHSVCCRLLRKYCNCLGYDNNFSIYDDEDSKKVLKKIIQDEYNIDANMVYNKIGYYKQNMIDYNDAIDIAETNIDKKIANYYKQYQIILKKNNAMDFNDLIFNMVKILENNYSIYKIITKQFKYIISDESQDSNNIDFQLVKLLGGDSQNICFVADDDQSIYGFRGANFETMMNLLNSNNFKEYQLKQNYRSTATIVNASRSLIEYNKNKKDKTIFTDNKEGAKIIYYREYNAIAEANRVLKIVKALNKKNKIPYDKIAILYRVNSASRVLEEAFIKNNIPYRIINGTNFYDRMEIKDIISYLKFALNPYDVIAFKRIINTPKRKIGEKSLNKILSIAQNNNCGTIDNRINLLEKCKEVKLSAVAQKNLNNFIEIFDNINKNKYNNVSDLIQYIIDSTGYINYLETCDNSEERIANITELKEIASHYDTLDLFFESVLIDNYNDNENNNVDNKKVNLLTIHSSKGLEYDAVIIIEANEGVIPHSKSISSSEIEEERRLFYVAMTRAKKYLFITSRKYDNFKQRFVYSDESRFVNEINYDYIIKVNQELTRSII